MEPSSGVSMTGTDTLSQVISGIAMVLAIYMVISAIEFVYNSFTAMFKDRVELFPNTYASGSKMYTAIQNPNNSMSKTIYFSDNQRSGIEFTYTMFINIKSDTFSTGEKKLYHILHKGYSTSYPLLGPGIFCWGDKNTIRVYMNCFDTWDNYVDIENIPIDKWFHLTVSCKGNTLYLYINGNLKKKMVLSNNTPPYQNYGNVYLFNNRKLQLSKTITTSLENDNDFKGTQPSLTNLNFDGAAKGMVSRVYYFSYALTYTEIQYLMNMAPSTVIESPDMSITPYLSDTWWVNNQGP
jgi:hypothetical protein